MAQKRKEITTHREIERIVKKHEQISRGKNRLQANLQNFLNAVHQQSAETCSSFMTAVMPLMSMIQQNVAIIILIY